MIEKICARLEEEYNKWADIYNLDSCKGHTNRYADGKSCAFDEAIQIVQEVANEHRKLNRCDTCNHYVADEVPPICYFCCKGMEDNYQQKGE